MTANNAQTFCELTFHTPLSATAVIIPAPVREQAQTAAAEPDPADTELDRVLAFIDTMPTWNDTTVVTVKRWLYAQLQAGAHRR